MSQQPETSPSSSWAGPTGAPDAIRLLWAKTNRAEIGTWHPLLCHLMDVACVARELWRGVLHDQGRRWIAQTLGLPVDAAEAWVAFLAGAHDIGKACPGFQAKWPWGVPPARQAGLTFPVGRDVPHGTVSANVLANELPQGVVAPPLPRELARCLAMTLGGHHGVFPTTSEWGDLGPATLGDDRWSAARRECLLRLAAATGLAALPSPRPPTDGVDRAAMMFLAGLVAVADWIGSNLRFFPFATSDWDPDEYWGHAAGAAQQAMESLAWGAAAPDNSPAAIGFAELFPGFTTLRPLQAEVERQAARLRGPGLVLVEAPMGEGKTEAALFLADRWNSAHQQRGIYVALPTQATSNQMFTRLIDFLSGRYPDRRVNLHLLHGHAALSPQYRDLQLAATMHDQDDRPGRVVAEAWFGQDKRQSLLAPFGVGTIDQALLSVLQTRHMFVRLFGLAGKTVVLDEVHAYDTYMTTLLERLLQWLAALGSSVVLLSATLPSRRRRQLLEAYAGGRTIALELVAYPRLSIVQQVPEGEESDGAGNDAWSVAIPASSDRRVELVVNRTPPERLAGELARVLTGGGGCCAIVRNTVQLAQQTYLQLRQALSPLGVEVELFHARFPFAMRDAIERGVLDRYGRRVPGSRPRAAVLVATQVIEQSLDLDFDLIASDPAPADLLLQRAGRLHRHQRSRPEAMARPSLWLLDEGGDGAGGVPDFGVSQAVYDRYVLLRSHLALAGRHTLRLPDDIEPLVEGVYGEAPLSSTLPDEWQTALDEALRESQRNAADDAAKARRVQIGSPWDEDDLLEEPSMQLEEEDPEVHATLRAATRLGPPNVSVVLLHRLGGEGTPAFLSADGGCGTELIDLTQAPSLEDARRLLGASVTLSQPQCVRDLLATPPVAAWRDSGLLRHHRSLDLDDRGCASLGSVHLRLDRELGVVLDRACEEDPE